MKTKQLLLVLILVNVIGIAFLVYNRTPPVVSPSASLPSDQAAEPRVGIKIPPRPKPDTSTATSEMQDEIEGIRSQAYDVAEFLVQRLPDSPAALGLLGTLHLRSGNPEGARQLWDHAIALEPDFAESYMDYGHLEENLGNTDKAIEYFQTAIEKDPGLLDAYGPLTQLLLAQGKNDEAVARLRQYLARQPESLEGWCRLGQAYQQLDDPEQAVRCYVHAMKLNPNSREAALGLMTAYRSQGDSQQAAQVAQRLASIEASQQRVAEDRNVVDRDRSKMQDLYVFTVQSAAQLLAQSGDVSSALSQLVKAQQVAPDSLALSSQLADLYFHVGRQDLAIQVLSDHCGRASNDPQAWYDLAVLCMKSRRLDAAERALRRFLDLVPDNARGYALLSQTQMPAERDPQAAVVSAQRAVELSSDAGNHYILATAFYHAGNMDASKAELKTAISMDPGNAEYQNALEAIE